MRNRLKISLLIATVSTFSWGMDMAVKQLNNVQGSKVLLKVTDRPGNPRDWIGVYPKGASSNWSNQVAWTWAKDSSNDKDWYKLNTSALPTGEYEARFFLNNSYIVEKKVSFAIKNTVTLSSADKYTEHKVSIKIKNQALSSKNWVGLYPAGSTNAWGNVVAWNWSTGKNKLSFTNIPSGKYEARIFYNNSFDIENAVYFTVENATVKNNKVAIQSDKNAYTTDDTIHLNLINQAADKRNWVGIYPSGSSNDWENVVDWTWTKGESSLAFNTPSVGNYEARIFYNNSFDTEDTVSFTVGNIIVDNNNTIDIQSDKNTYTPDDTIQLNIIHQAEDKQNWVGIYPVGSSNDWENVVDWTWTKGKNSLVFNAPSIGNYEARIFYNNSFDSEDKIAFSVSNNGGNIYKYGSEGQYLDKVKVDNSHDKYVVYYPEDHVQNAPLVLFLGFSDTTKGTSTYFRLEGMMKYVASLGCYVIGHKQITGGDSWNNISDTKKRREYFIDAVNEAKSIGVDTNKLGIVGKSAGGMHTYALMKYFKEQLYGTNKSFIIDDMGYYVMDMNKADLKALNIDALILHYGMDKKYTGIQEPYPQDPRTLLTVAHILKHGNNKVGFIPIATKKHSYESGDYNRFKKLHDLMQPIDAMIKYELFNENGQYNSASNILFGGYEQTRNKVIYDTLNYLGGNESETKSIEIYNEGQCYKNHKQINYCQDYNSTL